MDRVQPGGRSFLSLESKTSQSTVKERLGSLRAGERPAPVVVELDMTSFCDFECPECISASVLGTSRFTRERLLELCREMHELGVKAVILTGGGEPLRHHAATAVIDELSSWGISVGLITNGYSLTAVAPSLLRRMSWIRVSLDAGTAAQYVKFRPHPEREQAFVKVVAGIEHAIIAGCPRVGISYVLLTREASGLDNFDDVARAAELGRRLGASYLNVKAMQNEDHTVYVYTDSSLTRIKEALTLARKYETRDFKIVTSANLEAALRRDWVQEKGYSRCLSISLRTLITPEGMFPCAYHRGNLLMRYPTNPNVDDFSTMWASTSAIDVNPQVDCLFHCARHESNLELERDLAMQSGNSDHGESDWDLFI